VGGDVTIMMAVVVIVVSGGCDHDDWEVDCELAMWMKFR